MEISNDLSAMVKFLCPCSGMVINPSQSVKNKFHRPQPLGILPIPYESHGFSTRWFSMIFQLRHQLLQGFRSWLQIFCAGAMADADHSEHPRLRFHWNLPENHGTRPDFGATANQPWLAAGKLHPLWTGLPETPLTEGDFHGFPIDMFDCQRVVVVSSFLKTSLKSIEFDVPNFQPTLAFHWSGDVYIYIYSYLFVYQYDVPM